jgi:hypothetical protein
MDVSYEEGYFKNDCLDGKGLKGDRDGNVIVQGEFQLGHLKNNDQ